MFQNSYIFWVISGVIFLLADRKFSNTINLSLAYALLVNSGVAFKNQDNIKIQILSFVSLWILSYFLISRALKKERVELDNENNLDDFKDKQAIVLKDIGRKFSADGIGQIKYNNMTFKAKSVNDKKIKAGETVKIVSRVNKIFNVEVMQDAKN